MPEALNSDTRRFIILAEGRFDSIYAKTAICAIRYLPEQVVAVIDSRLAGSSVDDVTGFGGAIPVVENLGQGLAYDPNALLIGIAPAGGGLPDEWVRTCVKAAEAGLDIWSGMHASLAEHGAIADAARRSNVALHDLRIPDREFPVARGLARDVDSLVILTVGSDCAVGKMTAAVEVARALEQGGVSARVLPTGQTGILIEEWGVAVDAVKSDFVAGAAEWLVLEGARRGGRVLIVEGQGALSHPAYSGVMLGLLHGSMPHAMILCHEPGRREHVGSELEWTRVPELPAVVRQYETAAAWLRPAAVIGIALNTSALEEAEAEAAVELAARETELPATDPVRFGSEPLVAAIVEMLETR